MTSPHKFRVLFLCIHNSARSQMAEALLRKLGDSWFDVESAGFEPGTVLPEAVQAMAQIGIDISGARSRSVFELFRTGARFDYVITVCDEATAERCPIFPGVCERLHWTFPDPSAAPVGERLATAAAVRDQIRQQIQTWLAELESRGGPAPRLNKRENS